MNIRTCYVNLPNIFGGRDETWSMYHKMFHQFHDRVHGVNFTINTSDTIGNPVNGSTSHDYNGCIGKLQRNETDMVLSRSNLAYYGPDITALGVVQSDYKIMISTLDKDEFASSVVPRVLDFVEGYSCAHWLLTSYLTIFLVLLMYAGIVIVSKGKDPKKMKRFRKSAKLAALDDVSSVVMGCIVNQHGNCAGVNMSSFMNWIYTLMTLLAFFSAYFLTSMIKTEMVAMKRPQTFDTYQELLDHDVAPLWIKELSDQRDFEEARPGTNAKRLWDQAVVRGLNHSILSLRQSSMPMMYALVMRAIRREIALLTGNFGVSVAVSNICAASRSLRIHTNINSYISVDPEVQEVLKVILVRQSLPPFIMRQVRRIMQPILEEDTVMPSIKRNLDFFLFPNKNPAEVQECMAGIIIYPESRILRVPVYHYRDLLQLSAALTSFALVILNIERRIRPRKSSRRSQQVTRIPDTSD